MISYVAQRVISIVALAFGISVIVFLIIRLIPGDPVITLLGTSAGDNAVVDRLRQQLGLDLPMYVQYGRWISGIFRGDFGYSYGYQQSVSSLLAANFPATIQLTIAALALSLTFGMIMGIAAALKRNQAADTLTMGVALTCMSIPSFWLGLLLILVFAVTLPWFDVVGGTSLKGLVLPAVTLALGSMGFNARFVRSSIIAARVQKHVITARAKGITRVQVFVRHVFRNALLPIVTTSGAAIGGLIGGAVATETAFGVPGLGSYLVQALQKRDWMVIQNLVFIYGIIFVIVNLIVDLSYAWIDPRIRYQ